MPGWLVAWIVVGGVWFATGAWAQEGSRPLVPEAPADAILSVPSVEQVVGRVLEVQAALVNRDGEPQSNKVLVVEFEGEPIRRIRTDENGRARVRLPRDLSVGRYTGRVAFIGTQDYRATDASFAVRIVPAILSIETVPALAGIPFSLDGRVFVSGEDGIATIQVPEVGTHRLESLLAPRALVADGMQAEFARWGDSTFMPIRDVRISGDVQLQVGFELYHPVAFTFRDLAGKEVSWDRVASVTLQASNAVAKTVDGPEAYWLQANRVQRRRLGLARTDLRWSVMTVDVDGSSVVNRYQQRFVAEPNLEVSVELLLFDAVIRSADALFGNSIGHGVDVTYPNGESVYVPFDATGEAVLRGLARGLYRIQVVGATGVAPLTPMALSRDQDVTLKVLTRLDMIVGVVLGLTLAIGLPILGRPHLVGWKRTTRDRARVEVPGVEISKSRSEVDPSRAPRNRSVDA